MSEKINIYDINEIQLGNAEVGENINNRFKSIHDNFQKIISSEYLKGVKGDSIHTKDIYFDPKENTDLDENDQKLLAEITGAFKTLIKDNNENITDDRIELTGKVTLIYEAKNNPNEEPVIISSLPYVFKDKKFNDQISEINDNNHIYFTDLSCIICYQDNNWVKINSLPTLYYDKEQKDFCWKVNGDETGLLAKGLKGDQGTSGAGLYLALHKDVSTTDNNVYREITKICIPYDPDTNLNNGNENYEIGKEVDWVEVSKYVANNPSVNALTTGCLIFSTGDPNYENYKNGNESTEPTWVWGILFVDNSTPSKPIYKIRTGGNLGDLINTNGFSLLTIMANNTYTFIPYGGENTANNKPNGYSIYDESINGNHSMIIQPARYTVDNGLPTVSTAVNTENTTFKSLFNDNVFENGIQIGTGVNPIQIKPKYVSFEGIERVISGCMESATKLGDWYESSGTKIFTTIGTGSTKLPVYFANGVPKVCDNELNINISGQAKCALSLGSIDNTNNEIKRITIGSESTPVYFENGVPKACTSIQTPTDLAKKLGEISNSPEGEPVFKPLNIGASNKPVYFKDGVPVECSSTVTTKATAAEKLASYNDRLIKVGNASSPVYFDQGVPVQCYTDLDTNINGTANFAIKLAKNGRTFSDLSSVASEPELVTVGDESTPVYFKNGVPVECTNISSGSIIQGGYKVDGTIGDKNKPIYWAGDRPKRCDEYLNVYTKGSRGLINSNNTPINIGTKSNPVYFENGSAKDCYLTEQSIHWGDPKVTETNLSNSIRPTDIGLLDANRLAFMPPELIKIEYSNNGGTTWIDYGATDSQKQSLVSMGPNMSEHYSVPNFYLGKKSENQTSDDQLRITINANFEGSSLPWLNFNLKKILIHTSNGTKDYNVNIKWDAISHNIHGVSNTRDIPLGSCWSPISLLLSNDFGGRINYNGYTDIQNYNKITFTFKHNGDSARSCVNSIAMFGPMKCLSGEHSTYQNRLHPLARFGCVCGWDEKQNVIFKKSGTENKLVITPPSDTDPGKITLHYEGKIYSKSLIDILAGGNVMGS